MTADFETTDLAEVLTYSGKFGTSGKPEDTDGAVGFHQGQIESWDTTTGANIVRVLGTTINDLPVLSTADSIMLTEGDLVGVLRFQSTYFILGRIAPPGGGAALQMRSAEVAPYENLRTTGFYTDLATYGPELTDVYIGSSRRCLVILNAFITVNNSQGLMSFDVSGASTISASDNIPAGFRLQHGHWNGGTAAATRVLTGLNEGFHTFTARYKLDTYNTGIECNFQERTITVLPF